MGPWSVYFIRGVLSAVTNTGRGPTGRGAHATNFGSKKICQPSKYRFTSLSVLLVSVPRDAPIAHLLASVGITPNFSLFVAPSPINDTEPHNRHPIMQEFVSSLNTLPNLLAGYVTLDKLNANLYGLPNKNLRRNPQGRSPRV